MNPNNSIFYGVKLEKWERKKLIESLKVAPETRFYIHGDQHKDDPLLFYCHRCDLFFSKDHFLEENCLRRKSLAEKIIAHLERYIITKREWNDMIKFRITQKTNVVERYVRPSYAFNIWEQYKITRKKV